MAGAAKTAKPEEKAPERKGPAVIGINFGNAYASIAIINNVSSLNLLCYGLRDFR